MKIIKSFAAGLLVISATVVNAATIDFGVLAPTNTGSITYAGGASLLNGVDIEIDNVVGLGTPSNNNAILTCVSCVLNFTSGAHTSGWIWGNGGSISIVGGLVDSGSNTVAAAGTTLLSGSFLSAEVFDVGGGTLNFKILGTAFEDTKDEQLTAYYGMPNIGYVGGMNISFSATVGANMDFSSTGIFSGDVINQPVPVPAAVWLFGSGLLGLVAVARRRRV